MEREGDEEQGGGDGHGNELTEKHVGIRIPDAPSAA